MYYALIDMRNSCEAMTALFWGDLKSIAKQLIANAEDLIDSEGMTIEELEDEEDLDFSDYKKFQRRRKYTEEIVSAFYFELSDMTSEVGCLVEGYDKLVEAFERYAQDKPILSVWRLRPGIEETEENLNKIDAELRALGDLSCRDLKFFIKK